MDDDFWNSWENWEDWTGDQWSENVFDRDWGDETYVAGLPGANSVTAPGASGLQRFIRELFGPSGTGAGGTGAGGTGAGAGGGMNAFLPMLLGGLLGSQSGSQPAGSTTTTQDIPEWLKPYVTGMLDKSKTEFEAQVIDPNRNALLGPAQSIMSDTISGKYLDPATNPWLKSTYDQAAQSVTDAYKSTTQPRNDALFNRAGAFGPQNSAYAESVARNQFGLGTNLTDLATNIYGGNYNTERGRQASAAAGAPAFTTAASGSRLAPFNQYSDILKGIGGGQTTSPYFTNPIGGALSGMLTGFNASRLFGGGP